MIAKVSIAILVILAIVAFYITNQYELDRQNRSAVLSEQLKAVATALEQFKAKYGCYPPDHQSPTALSAFLKKSFPRATESGILAFQEALQKDPAKSKVISPSEALVLYLVFMSSDPRDPYRFATKMASDLRNTPVPSWKDANLIRDCKLMTFYEFSEGSLEDRDGDGFPEFVQKAAHGASLVYFDARTYTGTPVDGDEFKLSLVSQRTTSGAALPYASAYDRRKKQYTFYNPKSYQLICAGIDGQFGVDNMTGSPRGFPVLNRNAPDAPPRIPELDDNIANFTSGKMFRTFLAQE